jgi:hypothetical protein
VITFHLFHLMAAFGHPGLHRLYPPDRLLAAGLLVFLCHHLLAVLAAYHLLDHQLVLLERLVLLVQPADLNRLLDFDYPLFFHLLSVT